jgi:hypothetical protein
MARIPPVKKYLQFGSVLVLLLWLGGTLIFLPSTEDRLTRAAKLVLADLDGDGRSDLRNAYTSVSVSFSGQEATLHGLVSTEEDKARAAELIATKVKADGWLNGHLNPVTAVHNRIEIDPAKAPRPQPWLVVTLYGGNQRIDGLIASPDQRQELLDLMQKKLPAPAVPINNQLMTDETALPISDWAAALAGFPDLTTHPQDRSLVVAGRGDGTWTQLPPEVSTEDLAKAIGNATGTNEINHALGKMRAWKYPTPEELKQAAEAKAAAEKAAAEAKAAAEKAAVTPPAPAPAPTPAPAPPPDGAPAAAGPEAPVTVTPPSVPDPATPPPAPAPPK